MRRRSLRLGAAMAFLCMVASSCARTSVATAPTSGAGGSGLLASSTLTSLGAWATLPMGNLDQPLNTFWQLFFRGGPSGWEDRVKATATATNGGLVLAGQGPRVAVGVIASQNLTYSPVITSSDGGATWQSSALPGPLLVTPQSLAVGPEGQLAAAIVDGRGAQSLVVASPSLDSWRSVGTLVSLGQVTGPACEPTGIAALAYAGQSLVAGLDCKAPGLVGLVVRTGSSWRSMSVALRGPSASMAAEVLYIRDTDRGMSVLFGLLDPRGGGLEALEVAEQHVGSSGWQVSDPLSMGGSAGLGAVGPAGDEGFFTLFSGGSALWEYGGAPLSWQQLPKPPPASQDAEFGAGSAPQVLGSVSPTRLTVWSLDRGKWTPAQSIAVNIPFGSSA